MSLSLKELLLIVVLIIASIGLTRWLSPEKVIYETEHQERQIDSLTTALQNTRVTSAQLENELEGLTDGFRERLASKEEQVVSYNRMIGQLNLKIDSLQSVGSSISIDSLRGDDGVIRDTTLYSRSVFGDSLLVATARAGIRDSELFLDQPELRQLRPLRIDLAILLQEKENRVTSVVTSRDFEELHVEAFTALPPPRRRPPWFIIGVATGFIVSEIL